MSNLINKIEAEYYASELRNELELSIPFDLVEVLGMLGIEYRESPLDEGFDGAFIRADTLGIIVNNNIMYPTRKRFTIAHEIGHFYIPRHQSQQEFKCYKKNIDSFDAKNSLEYEADMFAAELLMPKEIFLKDIGKISPKISDIKLLSDKFETSLTSTAIRYVKNTDECCALVLMENKNIRWSIRSDSFKFTINKPKDCFAYDIIGSTEENIRDSLYSHYWLSGCSKEYVIEDVSNFVWLNQQLVLLTF
jgi:Zn-dependent peptidase ImmA (M78 family)